MDTIPELLQSHFEDPYHRGNCERATQCSQSYDRASQHFIAVELRIDDGGDDHVRVIDEAWFDSQGCVCCEGAASILVQYCEGRPVAELEQLDDAFYLKLTELDRIEEPASCQMLAWTAFQAAINSTEDSLEVDDNRPLFGGPSLGEES